MLNSKMTLNHKKHIRHPYDDVKLQQMDTERNYDVECRYHYFLHLGRLICNLQISLSRCKPLKGASCVVQDDTKFHPWHLETNQRRYYKSLKHKQEKSPITITYSPIEQNKGKSKLKLLTSKIWVVLDGVKLQLCNIILKCHRQV